MQEFEAQKREDIFNINNWNTFPSAVLEKIHM